MECYKFLNFSLGFIFRFFIFKFFLVWIFWIFWIKKKIILDLKKEICGFYGFFSKRLRLLLKAIKGTTGHQKWPYTGAKTF